MFVSVIFGTEKLINTQIYFPLQSIYVEHFFATGTFGSYDPSYQNTYWLHGKHDLFWVLYPPLGWSINWSLKSQRTSIGFWVVRPTNSISSCHVTICSTIVHAKRTEKWPLKVWFFCMQIFWGVSKIFLSARNNFAMISLLFHNSCFHTITLILLWIWKFGLQIC